MWEHQLQDLSKTHRVIAVDLRGHGESTVTTDKVTMSMMANDVHQLLDHLSIQDNVHLGGLSMGGYVAWEFWLQFRNRLKSLMLFDTRAVADTDQVARARRMMAAQVVTAGASMAAESMLPKLMSPHTAEKNPNLVRDVEAMILGTNPEAIASTQRGMAERRDMTDRLAEIDLPTLVVCGEDDTISPPAEMRKIADSMPNAKFVEIPLAGHLAPLEQPVQVTQAIANFVV